MYRIIEKQETVSIPPDELEADYEEVVTELTKNTFEGTVGKNKDMVISASEVVTEGQGFIVHGDGNVYQRVRFNALVFTPKIYEIVNGIVVEVLKFGAFIRFGPLEGLLHISQIMDERVDVDLANERLVGRESEKELKVGDLVRLRVVTCSINERNPKQSRIGFTMRQSGLGKLDWLEKERKEDKESKETGK